jgi:DNA repair protein RecO (recombination protein O)
MPLFADRAICLRKFEYSETSQILSLFGREQGLTRVLAKGAHRRTKAGASKFGGGVDLLEEGQADYIHDTNRELGTLTEWSLAEGHLALRQNLRGLYLGLYAAELVGMLIQEHDPHPNLFDRLSVLLGELTTSAREEAFVAFELDLLRESGYAVRLATCCACGRPIGDRQGRYFSLSRGGAVCRDCETAIPDRQSVDPRLLGLMQMIQRLPRVNAKVARLPRLTRHQTDPVNRLLAGHIQHVAGKRVRLGKYVLS